VGEDNGWRVAGAAVHPERELDPVASTEEDKGTIAIHAKHNQLLGLSRTKAVRRSLRAVWREVCRRNRQSLLDLHEA